MADLTIGDKAPDFSLLAQDGKKYSLKDFRGKKVVLYFYPEDDTETCTAQACSFRDYFPDIKKKDAVLLGISPDGLSSHQKFASKYHLNFLILSDETKSVMKQYGVWKRKQMFGRTYMGVIRTTFIIDANGIIVHIFPKVKVKGHAERVLQALVE
jgi:peroxiredoxin Q/BCP